MEPNSTFNILMYSHDTYGLGHIRRTMAIASHLRSEDINILILTGSPIAGRFSFPEQIDFVRIPGMIKKTNEEYLPLSIKINAKQALAIRKNIITATAKTFLPDLFIVDKEPFGLKKEVLPTLRWLRRHLPRSKSILGLRDIMDEASVVQRDWEKKGVYDILGELYDEIWVYGEKSYYDPIIEYAIPPAIAQKIHFTGYIPRVTPDKTAVGKIKKEFRIGKNEKLVVVTTGGGGDGYLVMDHFLTMLERETAPIPFKSVLITGPFMPINERRDVFRRCKRLKIKGFHFYRRIEDLLAAADLVISMGGYNTVCEILSQGAMSILVPRETPRKEQLIRAQAFSKQHLTDYIPWPSFTPEALREKVFHILGNSHVYRDAIASFRLTGFEVMRDRLAHFKHQKENRCPKSI